MTEKGTYRYIISQRDVDFTDRCTHTSLMNHILQAAGDDADLNGFGIKDLNIGNCSWVLSRMCTEFYRRPGQGEEIDVKTWVADVGKLMTTRNMIVFDGSGERIAVAVTQWAVINIDTRHAVDIRANVDYRGKTDDEPIPGDPPVRVPRIDSEPAATKKVQYSDIDFNRHMNAMKYIEWIIDNVPIDLIQADALKRIDINFLKEAVLGRQLSLHTIEDGIRRLCEIRAIESGDPLCRCALAFG
ncbi:MAG: acyl-[acyl-carrier-protein] thioesterase [Rikenellaceae bacterium]|nr:acyl-[acyl-carrier-protein] thioesterase [Rikenellaceae bacterium]